jgi:hypothetical protein
VSVDLISTSLTIHGTVCAASIVAVWKLGGESKFGTEKVSDLHNLRPKLLKAIASAVELSLNPILTAPMTESIEVDESGNPKPKPARMTVDGREALTNAMRDFVKSQSTPLMDLRTANLLDDLLTQSLRRLRHLACIVFAFTGIICLLLGASRFEWISLQHGWMHAIAFIVLFCFLLMFTILLWRILNASSDVDRLKSRYADI